MYQYVRDCPPERRCCNCKAPYTGFWRGRPVCCGDCLFDGCDCYPHERAAGPIAPTLMHQRWREEADICRDMLRKYTHLPVDEVARIIGMSKTTMYRRIKEAGLEIPKARRHRKKKT